MASSSPKPPSIISRSEEDNDPWIPEGYEEVIGPNGKNYIIPEFMTPAFQQDYQAKDQKADFDTFCAAGSVSIFIIIRMCITV